MVLTEAQWATLKPLVEVFRPHAKEPPSDLRRTIDAILWRRVNNAKWRSNPSSLGPSWKAAQIFIRWVKVGVWERLLALAQKRRVELGMALTCPPLFIRWRPESRRESGALARREQRVIGGADRGCSTVQPVR